MYIKKNRGMTIVEILVASLILSLVLMGYIQTQMRSIINTEYSNKASVISSSSNDFTALFSNYILNESTDDGKNEVIQYFLSANWENENYSSNLKDCDKEDDIDDTDVCDKEMMVHYLVKGYKDNIKNIIPESKFDFGSCNSSNNLCLIVSWSEDSPNENECRVSTTNCLVVEVQK